MLAARKIANEVRVILLELLRFLVSARTGFPRARNSTVLQTLGCISTEKSRFLLMHGTCQFPVAEQLAISIYVFNSLRGRNWERPSPEAASATAKPTWGMEILCGEPQIMVGRLWLRKPCRDGCRR